MSDKTILVADIGGTHTRFGLVDWSGNAGQTLQPAFYKSYCNQDYSNLTDIFNEYQSGLSNVDFKCAAIAVAGYMNGNNVVSTSIPWVISKKEISSNLNNIEVKIINDFSAVAYGICKLSTSDKIELNPNAINLPEAPCAIIGPGTGMGAALLMRHSNGKNLVVSSEAGSANIAVSTQVEIEILKLLQSRLGHISIEKMLSGPGILNIYQALCEVKGVETSYTSPAEVTNAAVNSNCKIAIETLNVFCELMGSFSGDMALMYGARGGVYIAGGVISHFKDFFCSSNFMQRFKNKGDDFFYLEKISVNLIDHGRVGLIGAANWYFETMD